MLDIKDYLTLQLFDNPLVFFLAVRDTCRIYHMVLSFRTFLCVICQLSSWSRFRAIARPNETNYAIRRRWQNRCDVNRRKDSCYYEVFVSVLGWLCEHTPLLSVLPSGYQSAIQLPCGRWRGDTPTTTIRRCLKRKMSLVVVSFQAIVMHLCSYFYLVTGAFADL